MSKVLVRKQMDPKQAVTNLATVSDTSNSGVLTQLGLLNLLGDEKSIAQDAAEKLGYDMDSKQYKRLRTGERIGQGLAGAYGGFRALDTLASGRSPTSAMGAGFGAYGNVLPHSRKIGVRAASRGMKPAEPAPEKTRQTTLDEFSDVKPPVIVKPSTSAASPAAASSIAVVKPSPLEVAEHEGLRESTNVLPEQLGMTQMVFPPENAGLAQPAKPMIAGPTPEETAEGFSENQVQVLAQQGNQSGNVRVAQSQPKGKSLTEEQMKRLMEGSLDRFMDTEAKQSGAVQGA